MILVSTREPPGLNVWFVELGLALRMGVYRDLDVTHIGVQVHSILSCFLVTFPSLCGVPPIYIATMSWCSRGLLG